MATHDYNIANASGAAVRADINDVLSAAVTWNSGTSWGTTFARQRVVDTSLGVVKRRNAANGGWIIESTDDETRVLARSSNTILDESDVGKTVVATSSFTQTFTAAATLGDGWWCAIRNDGTGVITLDPNSSEQIDGATTQLLYPGEGCLIICNASAFKTVAWYGRKAVTARSSNTILALADHGKTFVATSTFTQTLTAVATLGAGWWVNYRNDGTGVITLDPNSSEQINGATTLELHPGESCLIICDGSAFKTVGLRGVAVKVGSTTYDASTTGSLAITGVGFQPTAVLLHCNINGTSAFSVGFFTGGAQQVTFDDNVDAAGTYAVNASNAIYMTTGAGVSAVAALASLDDDGFTLTKAKNGSPTGTVTVQYLAIR